MIADVQNALDALANDPSEELRKHAERLVRRTGSSVAGIDSWPRTYTFLHECEWEEVSWKDLPPGAGHPVARYFRAPISGEWRASKNTITVAEARKRGLALEVQVHKPDPTCPVNPRGLGVFTSDRADVATPTREVWIILGPSGDKVVPWTWHPGAPAVPVTKAMYEALDAGRWDDPILAEVNVHLPQ
jgi:hypothetical protein